MTNNSRKENLSVSSLEKKIQKAVKQGCARPLVGRVTSGRPLETSLNLPRGALVAVATGKEDQENVARGS